MTNDPEENPMLTPDFTAQLVQDRRQSYLTDAANHRRAKQAAERRAHGAERRSAGRIAWLRRVAGAPQPAMQ
jgi:hypothetical protein